MSEPVITSICNMALSHLGQGLKISNYETDRSVAGIEFRTFYPIAKPATLRDFPWPFSTVIEALNLVQSNPNTEWAYSYRYPSQCKMVRRILSGVKHDTVQSRVPYKIARDDQGKLIYTMQSLAYLEYTSNQDDESRFTEDFILALSWRLAAYVAPVVTGGDPFKLGAAAMQMYLLEISKAEKNAFEEERQEEETESEFTRSRN